MGERANLSITVGRSYSGAPIKLPIHVWRGKKEGPTVFISAAVHGDELNGTGAIRTLILDPPFQLKAGNLILVPVMNILAFERLSRYSPDRRDLNRCFPGIENGSLTSRLARVIFDNIVAGLGMVDEEITKPAFRMVADKRTWIRATAGGFLQFHVLPGDVVVEGQPIATNISLVGEHHHVMEAPQDAIVLGMTTLPAVLPGDPVCHLAFPSAKAFKKMKRAIGRLSDDSLLSRLYGDLSTNMVVADAAEPTD